MHKWKESRKDFFYFRPATQEKDVESDDDSTEMFSFDGNGRDDILYGQPTTFEGESGEHTPFCSSICRTISYFKEVIEL